MKKPWLRLAWRPGIAGGFTLIELLIVVAIIGILLAMLMPALAKAKCVAMNATCMTAIADLTRAFEAYDSDFATYPSDPSWGATGKAGDSKVFVKCLQAKGPKFTSYYTFKEGDIEGGEFMSPHSSQFYYTWPASNNNGPDGMLHASLPYLLWTKGCLGVDPDINWENNNWTK